jgi:hypothetical protein
VPYVVAGVALLLLATAVVGLLATDRSTGPVTLPLPSGLTTPGDPGSFGATPPAQPPRPDPSGAATRPPATPGPSGSAGPSAGPDPSGPASPGPARLVARYATVERGALGLGGYTGQVSISNPGDAGVVGWQVILTLPSGATVDDASGARATQSGRTVTFTPTDATRDVGGGATVEFTFTVSGLLAGQPTGCAIDGHPCS